MSDYTSEEIQEVYRKRREYEPIKLLRQFEGKTGLRVVNILCHDGQPAGFDFPVMLNSDKTKLERHDIEYHVPEVSFRKRPFEAIGKYLDKQANQTNKP